MTFVSELQPTALWSHFDTILTIPRGSKHEEQARDFVTGIVDKAGAWYSYNGDRIGQGKDKVRTFMKDIEPVIEMGPDALIMSDPGLIMLVRERWPQMPIHLSVQANHFQLRPVRVL